jgi:hypothetical protein
MKDPWETCGETMSWFLDARHHVKFDQQRHATPPSLRPPPYQPAGIMIQGLSNLQNIRSNLGAMSQVLGLSLSDLSVRNPWTSTRLTDRTNLEHQTQYM